MGRRSNLVDDSHCINCPLRYGDIDIPIYVNPASLKFEVDDFNNQLFVTGFTKGYYGGCHSLNMSTTELHPEPESTHIEQQNHLSRSRSCHRSTKSVQEGSLRRSLKVCHSSKESVRRSRSH